MDSKYTTAENATGNPGYLVSHQSSAVQPLILQTNEEEAHCSVEDIIQPNFDDIIPKFQFIELASIEKQFCMQLTLEMLKVSKFYANRCAYFAKQVLPRPPFFAWVYGPHAT